MSVSKRFGASLSSAQKKENEKKNSIEGIKEDIIKRGTLVKKYEGYGYSNQQIAKIISKPERPNNYKFFLARFTLTPNL